MLGVSGGGGLGALVLFAQIQRAPVDLRGERLQAARLTSMTRPQDQKEAYYECRVDGGYSDCVFINTLQVHIQLLYTE